MNTRLTRCASTICLALFLSATAMAVEVNFEGLPVDGSGYYNGDLSAGSPYRDNYTIVGTNMTLGVLEYEQIWEQDGMQWNNHFTPDFGTWHGWSWSRVVDATTAGFFNQYASAPGGGSDGMGGVQPGGMYAVAFGIANNTSYFNLPEQAILRTVDVTNSTYAALSMRDGDFFAKKFGGPTGDDPDYFTVTLTGFDQPNSTGNVVGSETVYLADFRFADNADDYILTDWMTVDLAALANARSVGISFDSSDIGPFGINTPTYLVVDRLVFDLVPEPCCVWSICCLCVIANRGRRQDDSRVRKRVRRAATPPADAANGMVA